MIDTAKLSKELSDLMLKAKKENVTVPEPKELTPESVKQYETLINEAIKQKKENEKQLSKGDDLICPVCLRRDKAIKGSNKSCINCNTKLVTQGEFREIQKEKNKSK